MLSLPVAVFSLPFTSVGLLAGESPDEDSLQNQNTQNESALVL